MGLQFLKAFNPNADALLRRMSTNIDDATLGLIADQDPVGGGARRARFMNALRNIRDGGPLRKQSDFTSWDEFYDQDVTELLEFSLNAEPDTDRHLVREWRGSRGHWPRAFASAVLVRAYGDEEVRQSVGEYYNYAVMPLVESIRRLDAGLESDAIAVLAWFIIRLGGDEGGYEFDRDQLAFAGVGILSLAVNSQNMISYDAIMELADWLIVEEKRAFDAWRRSVGNFPNHWLFRTTFFDKHREKWMAIGAELAAFAVTGACGDAVRDVGKRLSAQTPMS